jgi:SAM-dependent methyltransferase
MQQTKYEYSGMMAEFWDLLRGDTATWPDRFFFKAVVALSGEPVLDVGCGTGRLLLDFMQDGIDIDGVDNSPDMLERCRQKAAGLGLEPRLYQQPMETLKLPRKYQTIIVPSSSFQLVTDKNAAWQVMHNFFNHLHAGGVLVMPFMLLYTGDHQGNEAVEEWSREVTRPADGATIRRWSRSRFDLVNNLEHTEDRYAVIVDGQLVASEEHTWSPATRGYTQAEAVNLYWESGFVDIRVTSDFTQEPVKPEDTIFCVWGRRPD